jgi:hypothetical protein
MRAAVSACEVATMRPFNRPPPTRIYNFAREKADRIDRGKEDDLDRRIAELLGDDGECGPEKVQKLKYLSLLKMLVKDIETGKTEVRQLFILYTTTRKTLEYSKLNMTSHELEQYIAEANLSDLLTQP